MRGARHSDGRVEDEGAALSRWPWRRFWLERSRQTPLFVASFSPLYTLPITESSLLAFRGAVTLITLLGDCFTPREAGTNFPPRVAPC